MKSLLTLSVRSGEIQPKSALLFPLYLMLHMEKQIASSISEILCSCTTILIRWYIVGIHYNTKPCPLQPPLSLLHHQYAAVPNVPGTCFSLSSPCHHRGLDMPHTTLILRCFSSFGVQRCHPLGEAYFS